MKKFIKWLLIGGGILIALLCVIFGAFSGGKEEPPTTEQSIEAQVRQTIEASYTQTAQALPTATPLPKPTATPLPNPIVLEDNKPNVFDIEKWEGAGLVHLKYDGASNFIVDSLNINNESTAWGLANAIGRYEGWAIIDEGGDTQSTRVEVSHASSTYTITISPLSPDFTRSMEIPGTYSGNMPDVIYLNGSNPDLIKFVYTGDSNFIVDALDLYGNSTAWGLVNEIGVFEGTKIIPSDTEYIYISHASGPYTIEITTK